MTYKYQLILLGDTGNDACNQILKRFQEKVSDCGLTFDMFEEIRAQDFFSKYKNNLPTFAYYFGSKRPLQDESSIIKRLMDHGDAIFPLYFGEDFKLEVSAPLDKMNGKRYNKADIETYVNCAFESMRLLRGNRKLFISYRRNDSSAVANQLFDTFTKHNYDIFLDTYSMNPAVDFQKELFHRMTDCDVIIQLYTKDFKNSPWCTEEIFTANQKQIGIVELVWPDCVQDRTNQLCTIVELKEDQFKTDSSKGDPLLTDKTIENIVQTVESVRARNLAARQDNLIGDFIKEGQEKGHTLIKEYKYLIEHLENNKKRIFIPAVGVPQSYDCYDSLHFKEDLEDKLLDIYLIYDDLRICNKWIEHLDWLNESLEVKTIKKKDFASWLTKN